MGWRANLAAAALCATAALAETPGETVLAHDLALAPPEGAEITLEQAAAPGDAAIPMRSAIGGTDPNALYEGRVLRRAFRLEGEESTLDVLLDYETRLAARGFTPILRCATEACGGFAFRNAVEVFEQPAMAVNLEDFRQLTMRLAGEGRATLASILISRLGGWTLGQIVLVEDARPAIVLRGAPPEAAQSPPEAASPTAAGDDDADGGGGDGGGADPASPAPGDLIALLRQDGRAVLDGVDFVSGSTALTDAAGPALDRVAEALAAAPDVSVIVVGHTDASGSLEANLAVSRRRAESVAAALRARGVEADRLGATGAAFLAPVASNATAEGRNQNRRVELVLR
jgi:OOP family OmpA-OmpF porin